MWQQGPDTPSEVSFAYRDPYPEELPGTGIAGTSLITRSRAYELERSAYESKILAQWAVKRAISRALGAASPFEAPLLNIFELEILAGRRSLRSRHSRPTTSGSWCRSRKSGPSRSESHRGSGPSAS